MMLEQIASCPVEDRVIIADAVIESLNGVSPEVESAWGSVSSRRMRELRTGKVKGVSATAVFAHARSLCKA